MKSVNQTYRSVCQVKSDFQVLRALHSRQLQTFEHFMKYSCSQIMSHIRKANLNDGKASYSVTSVINNDLFSQPQLFSEDEETRS